MFLFYFIFDSPYNFYFELSFKSQTDFKRFFNFKANMILTLNFKNVYWERTSAITIKYCAIVLRAKCMNFVLCLCELSKK